MATCSLADPTSQRVYSFYFQINRQSPHKVDGINFQTYIQLKNSNSFALKYINDLINSKTLLNEDDNIDSLYKSLDGVDFEIVETEEREVPTLADPMEIIAKDKESQKVLSIQTLVTSHSNIDKAGIKKTLKVDLKPQKTKKSGVWTFFVKTSSGGTCKMCNVEVKGPTTNMSKHLARYHHEDTSTKFSTSQCPNNRETDENENKTENSQIVSKQRSPKAGGSGRGMNVQPRIDTTVAKISSFRDGARAGAIKNALLYMIVKDDMPLNTVDKNGFKYFTSVVAPHFKLPSRTSITEALSGKYDVLSGLVRVKLSKISYITLTADVWTDTMNSTSYLGCTAHFLDEDRLASLVLGVVELNERHTAEYLQATFRSVCGNWGIPIEKVTAIVTDNGANIVKAACDTFGSSHHLACFAHSLNLVLTRVVHTSEPLTELIAKIKVIITFFKQSMTAADELRKSQVRVPPLRLIQDVPTRWNSTFYMLERFLDLLNAVSLVLLKLPQSPPMLTSPEVAIIREILQLLRPAEIVSKEMCGQTYVTSSKIMPIVYCLRKSIEEIETMSDMGDSFKNQLLNELDHRYKGIELNNLTSIASLLDPRFKRLHFPTAVSCARAVEKIAGMLKRNKQSAPVEKIQDETSTGVNNVWKFHIELVNKTKTNSVELESGLDADVKQYLSKSTIPLTDDPIKYWSQQKENCPRLASIALKYLSIVATSVPCERLFSMAGHVAMPSRNRLSSEHIAQILFLKSLEVSEWRL